VFQIDLASLCYESEAHMRKNASFAVAATMLVLATIFWAKSSVVATSAYMGRPKLGMSYVVMLGSFLPVKMFEPIW
jgi:hypothetical protein